MDKVALMFCLIFLILLGICFELIESEANDGWADDCTVIGKHRYDGKSYSCKPE